MRLIDQEVFPDARCNPDVQMNAHLVVSDSPLRVPLVDRESLAGVREEVSSRDGEEVEEVALSLSAHENEDVRILKLWIDRIELLDRLVDIVPEPVKRRVRSCATDYCHRWRRCQLTVEPQVAVDGLNLAKKREIRGLEDAKVGCLASASLGFAEALGSQASAAQQIGSQCFIRIHLQAILCA